MFGYAFFGADPFAVNWGIFEGPTPPTYQDSGGGGAGWGRGGHLTPWIPPSRIVAHPYVQAAEDRAREQMVADIRRQLFAENRRRAELLVHLLTEDEWT